MFLIFTGDALSKESLVESNIILFQESLELYADENNGQFLSNINSLKNPVNTKYNNEQFSYMMAISKYDE